MKSEKTILADYLSWAIRAEVSQLEWDQILAPATSLSAPDFRFGPAERQNADALIRMALIEDFGALGDITTDATIPEKNRADVRFTARSAGVVAGLPVVGALAARFRLLHAWRPALRDGTKVEPGTEIARLSGPLPLILAMERTALNFLQRLSGVATLTGRFVEAVRGTKAEILDTRKTTPGWRALEKYAVRCGGGRNHRIGLYDAVLIKDNHLAGLAATGDPIGTAVRQAKAFAPPKTVVEVEVDSLAQLDRALECGPDIILVDNFDTDMLREAVRRRDAMAPGILLEASGGITLESVRTIAETGVDRISVGALTHSARALDIGLDFID